MKPHRLIAPLLLLASPTYSQQITALVESGGDNEATDTISAQWTGQVFPISIAGEPTLESVVGETYTVGVFGDRAPAFVDRNHRYINSSSATNGPDPAVDIPPYLLDLPYILSGNDNRDNATYQLAVTVDKPARVYMLIDNRLSDGDNLTPPTFGPAAMQWILDEGWTPTSTGSNRLGDPAGPDELAFDEGANDDIQQWYSIYFKDVAAGTFILRQADNAGRNMYGALVGPLPEPTDPVQIFNAQPSLIALGEKSLISWQIAPTATSATIDNGVGDIKPLTNATGGGSIEVSPTETTTYTLTVNTPGGNETVTTTVTLKLLDTFAATPAAITPGQSSTLAWSVYPGASVSIEGIGDVTSLTNAAGDGSVVVTPTVATRYSLTATRLADSVTATTGVGILPPSVRYALIDIGATSGIVEPGAAGEAVVGAGVADTNLTDLTATPLTSDSGDEFTLAIEAIDPDGNPVGGLDWRDRGDAPNVPLAHLGEDFVKNNLGMIRVTLGSLPAGTYDVTSYHIDATFSQSEEIKILVNDATTGGLVSDTGIIASAAYADHPLDTSVVGVLGLNTLTVGEKAVSFRVTSNGTNDVVIYFDSRFAPLDDEGPLSGLLLVQASSPPPAPLTLSITPVDPASVRLSWPASAPASVKLQTSTSLQTTSWSDDTTPVNVIGSEKVVVEPLNGPVRFFRLVQP